MTDPRLHRLFVTNDTTSPAVTLNFATSFGSFSDMLELYRKNFPLPHFDLAAFEMFTIVMCKLLEVDYTRKLADRFNDFWQFLKNSIISLTLETSPAMLCQDSVNLFADLALHFLSILEEINLDSPSKRVERDGDRLPVNSNNYKILLQSEAEEIESMSSTAVESPPGGVQHSSDLSGQQQNLKQESEGSEDEHMGGLDFNENNGTRHQSDTKYLWSELREDSELSTVTGVLPFQDVYSSDEDDEKQPSIDDPWHMCDLWFGKAPELKEAPSKQKKFRDLEEAKPFARVVGIDYVPAFKVRGWPKVAREWITRYRKWPSPETVDKVIREGYHLVVKPPKNNGNPESDFRISFSHAEYLLSQEMNDIQRECYRCLKKCHRAYLSTQPESLVSFHLKTILLQTIEETGAEMWTESNRAECMMNLLGNLIKALREKHLHHFFVQSCNLFSEDYIESPELLDSLIVKVEKIMERPVEFANYLIKDEKEAKQSRGGWQPICKENLTGSELAECPKARALQLAEIEATPSESNSDIQGNQEMMTASVLSDTEVKESTGSYPSYYELKDIYLDICQELTDLALSNTVLDSCLESLGDLERKLVATLREYAVKYEADHEKFSQLFEVGWDNIYVKIWLSNEGLNITRMLNEIQGLVELWKEPNEESESRPMNPFDLDALIVSGVIKTTMRRLARSFLEPGTPAHS
ncbi:hypothetical protein ACROYT_G036760 [Oculina patagonica]